MKFLACVSLACCLLCCRPGLSQSTVSHADPPAGILTRDKAGPLIPQTVFFDGSVASVQARNSSGLRLPGNKVVLASLVDNSGYASEVRVRYQAILLTTAALQIGGKRIEPGQYGFGFLDGDSMVVMNLAAQDVVKTSTTRDPGLARPVPLQMIADKDGKSVRLYLGRSYVVVQPVQ